MAVFQPFQSLPSSLVGGNVVSLLLRQALLRTKIHPQNLNPTIYLFGAIPVNVRTQEVYTYSTEITKHAVEDGTIYTDHVILQPVQIDLSFEISNMDPDMIKYSFDLLVQMRNQRAPLKLLTEHQIIPNVILLNLKLMNSVPLWNTIVVQASFQQLSLVRLAKVDFPINKVEYPDVIEGQTRPPDPDVSKSLESPVNIGLKVPEPAQSVLSGLFSTP